MANACITNSRRPDVAMQEYHAGAAQLSSYSQAAKAPPLPLTFTAIYFHCKLYSLSACSSLFSICETFSNNRRLSIPITKPNHHGPTLCPCNQQDQPVQSGQCRL